MNFPTLYKQKDAKKWLVWNIHVSLPCKDVVRIVRNHGLEHGTLIESVKLVSCGKNIGKKNETTAYEQACLEATSMWNKQKATHSYVEQKTSNDTSMTKGPMLAHSFDKHSSKITFPCFAQPKLDGVRLLCTINASNEVTCLSRTCKPFSTVPLQNIIKSVQKMGIQNITLDGELYTPNLVFEEIVGICRNHTKPDKSKYDKLMFHVYDIIPMKSEDMSMDYIDRLQMLKSIVKNKTDPYVTLVDTCTLRSIDEIYDKHDHYVSLQFEGIILRNIKGTYVSTRSYNLQKYKHFQDTEFIITDVKEAVGNDVGTAILQCATSSMSHFWVRPKGSREHRTRLLASGNDIVGKYLTVRYQNLTDNGLPRFPVGVSIRDYE